MSEDGPGGAAGDWRLAFAERLRGRRFRRRRWSPAPGDDHDHCGACWAKFVAGGPLAEGWRSAEGEWLCHACFVDLGPRLGWSDAEAIRDAG
jgi:hypothetical protein